MISAESKAMIIENNATITKLLKENEARLIQDGFDVPVQNYVPDKAQKIQIPSGYIRVNETFQKKYHLQEIVRDQAVKKNIAYSLQLSDFYNYIINRFNVWGSVETMFLKDAVINLVSVFEALVFECANNICCNTSTCTIINECANHFTNKQRNNSYEALVKMNQLHIVNYSEKQLSRIKEIIELRNRVHIRLATENEFNNADFSISLYNEVIQLIQQLSDCIYTNGFPLYYQCN